MTHVDKICSVIMQETITSYNDELLTWAQKMLCEALDTKPLDIPCNMRAPCMAVIGLPESPKDKA